MVDPIFNTNVLSLLWVRNAKAVRKTADHAPCETGFNMGLAATRRCKTVTVLTVLLRTYEPPVSCSSPIYYTSPRLRVKPNTKNTTRSGM